MKAALQRGLQKVTSILHNDSYQMTKQVGCISRSADGSTLSASSNTFESRVCLSTFPLAETGWEYPPQGVKTTTPVSLHQNNVMSTNTIDEGAVSPPVISEYKSSLDETLARLMEIDQLGKSEVSFHHLQSALKATYHTQSSHHVCYLCGRTKFLNELCNNCASSNEK